MNIYQKKLHQLVKIDMKNCKDFEPLWDETYRFHKCACKHELREIRLNDTIQGIEQIIQEENNL